MAEVRSKFTNRVDFRIDRQSVGNVRKQVKKISKEFQDLLRIQTKLTGVGSKMMSGGVSPPKQQTMKSVSPDMGKHDSHVNKARQHQQELLRSQEKFRQKQEEVIERYLVSKRHLRQMSDEQKDIVRSTLRQAETAKELSLLVQKERGRLSDKLDIERKLTQEKSRQLVLQKRLRASAVQMLGTFGSLYTLMAGGQHVINVGTQFEGMNKAMIVASGSSEEAAQNFKFVRDEAMRLGVPLTNASKAFAKLKAAAGDKVTTEQIKGLFKGVAESGAALSLSADDMNGVFRAVVQMMSKGKVNL